MDQLPEALQQVLTAHELWLKSAGKDGQRADLSGAKLHGLDLAGANLRGAIMRGALLDKVNLQGAQLVHADMRDTQLCAADLTDANLLLTDFTGADLSNAVLYRTSRIDDQLGHVRRGPRFKDANLQSADMREAICYMTDFTGAVLSGAKLDHAELEGANLEEVDLGGLDLREVDLSQANLCRANLAGACLIGANLNQANLQGATLSDSDVRGANLQSTNMGDTKVDGIRYNRNTKFRGIRASSCYGSSRFRRFAEDQDYIEEFEIAHPGAHFLWLWLTDCGRSMLRVAAWSLFFIASFSGIYWLLGEQSFVVTNVQGLGWSMFTTTYYSVVTFTTLGFGDITPTTPLAATIVMIEVVVGYVMLGILISILATKVARRS